MKEITLKDLPDINDPSVNLTKWILSADAYNYAGGVMELAELYSSPLPNTKKELIERIRCIMFWNQRGCRYHREYFNEKAEVEWGNRMIKYLLTGERTAEYLAEFFCEAWGINSKLTPEQFVEKYAEKEEWWFDS